MLKKFKGHTMTSHNPYFNRWFSAIIHPTVSTNEWKGHNPYFNRWFSAINKDCSEWERLQKSQSLF